MEIFKVQVSLIQPTPEKLALVYNESRSVEGQFPASEELLDLMAGEPKKYFLGEVYEDGKVSLHVEVPEQDW